MDKIKRLKAEFEACQKILIAFGDEVRQHLLLLMVTGDRNGVRVSEIAEKTNLTCPAVSHHMQILKDVGIVKSCKEGKFIYYCLDSSCRNVDALIRLFESVKDVIQSDKAENNSQL